ncbi:MAG: hypothetical protein IKS90_01730 [Clostridia bacterium]|nr:hypothetical protein [Clostridia bacterium]
MKYSKTDISTFFVWLRNGFSFGAAWLTILLTALLLAHGRASVHTLTLAKLLLFAFGGALLFSLWFSPFPFKKMRFIGRLTGFFITFSAFELLFFYLSGIFTADGTTVLKVLSFIGIVGICYLACVLLDRFHFAKKGDVYTKKLNDYKSRGS